MYYIVALGNPGPEYVGTRHNVGWAIADIMVKQWNFTEPVLESSYHGRVSEGKINESEASLLYPDTFMNNSGTAVRVFVPKAEVTRLVVLYDDVALPLGKIRLSFGRGDGGHNGIRSIIKDVGTTDFIRLRVGIAQTSFFTGEVKRKTGADLPKFVLGRFNRREQKTVEVVSEQVLQALETIIGEGLPVAMNKYN